MGYFSLWQCPGVGGECSSRREFWAVPALGLSQCFSISFHVNGIERATDRVVLIAGVDDGLGFLIESQRGDDFKRSRRELAFQLRFRPIEFVEINVLVAVAAGLINEPLAVPRKELDWVERFKIFAVAFFEEGGYERTVCCAVGIKLAMFL